MSILNKLLLIGLSMIASLFSWFLGLFGVEVPPRPYEEVVYINWEITLPKGEAVYQKDDGASFHGDGARYHVFCHQDKSKVEGLSLWQERKDWDEEASKFGYEATTIKEVSEGILNHLEVEEDARPPYESCLQYAHGKNLNSTFERYFDYILLFWDGESGKLYVVESFT